MVSIEACDESNGFIVSVGADNVSDAFMVSVEDGNVWEDSVVSADVPWEDCVEFVFPSRYVVAPR